MQPATIISFIANAVMGTNLIVASTTTDKVKLATAATDLLLGTTDSLGAEGDGKPVGIALNGVAQVLLGGTVANGNALTSDGASKAIACAPATTVRKRIIGYALQEGVAGDIINYRVAPGEVVLGA